MDKNSERSSRPIRNDDARLLGPGIVVVIGTNRRLAWCNVTAHWPGEPEIPLRVRARGHFFINILIMAKNAAENKRPCETTLRAARKLEKKGFRIVWCGADKTCRLKDWPHTSRSLDQLKEALADDHTLSIAIVLNQSPHIDVECDTPEAEKVLCTLCNGRIPDTPTWQSARGKHRLFLRPEGVPDKASVKIDGVEFRGLSTSKGALSIVPPSGGRQWLPGLSLDDLEPAKLPLPIIERLRPQRPKKSKQNLKGEPIPEGERNNALFKLACALLRADLNPDDVAATLQVVNQTRCQPPLPDTELNEIYRSATKEEQKPLSHARILMGLAMRSCELWKTADDKPFATIDRNGHKEHWAVRSSTFRQWLSRQFYKSEGSVIGSQTLSDTLNTLEGQALFDGETRSVFLRIAGDDDRIFIDICNDTWQVIEVGKDGWRVIDHSPVRFRRSKGMLSLPMPQRGGSIDLLRPFVNVNSDGWFLLIAWILAALRPASTYPILKLVGEQGSAKSTLTKIARAFVDHTTDPLLSPPRSREDLMTAANNYWVLAFDNLSYIDPEMSDAFCRLSTGGSMGKRRLYSDDELHTLSATRPLLFNGIEDPGTRSDLMDRCVNLELLMIEEEKRKSDVEFWSEFEKVRPLIFGAVLDLLSLTLQRLPEVRAKKQTWPRMADFAQFGEASEAGLDIKPGYNFRIAYKRSQENSHRIALESTPITRKLLFLLEAMGGEIELTATDLHTSLCDGEDTRQRGWPKTPRVLSGLLGRMAPNLRGMGLKVSHFEKAKRDGTKNKDKFWRIVDPKRCPQSSQRPQDYTQNLTGGSEGAEPPEDYVQEEPPEPPPEEDYVPCEDTEDAC